MSNADATPPTHEGTARSDRPPSGPDIEALRAREPTAIRKWVLSQTAYLRNVLVHYGTAPDDLPEVLQEVLYQALDSLPSFRGEAKVRTWLHSIARNVAYSHTRTEQRYQSLPRRDVVDTESWGQGLPDFKGQGLFNGANNPSNAAVRSDQRRLIEDALDELPDHYEEVVRRRDLSRETTAEAADAIGITPVNTRVRLHRARKRLRALLRPYFNGRGS